MSASLAQDDLRKRQAALSIGANIPIGGTYDLGSPIGGGAPAGERVDFGHVDTLGQLAQAALAGGGMVLGGPLGLGLGAIGLGSSGKPGSISGLQAIGQQFGIGDLAAPASDPAHPGKEDALNGMAGGAMGQANPTGGAGAPAGPALLAKGGVVRAGPAAEGAPIFGIIRGAEPGVDTVDAMLAEGSYVIPRHAVEAMGEAPADAISGRYGDPGESSGGAVQARVSGGEYVMSPAQVERAGGAEALDREFGVESQPRDAYAEGGEVRPGGMSPSGFEAPMPMVRSPEEADALPPGTKFRSPDRQVRVRPYDVTDDTTYQAVPQGEYYREGGKLTQKPTSDAGVNSIAQTLYDMAKTPAGQKEALAFIYGSDAIQEDRGEFYVISSDGRRLSPKARNLGALATRAIGGVASGALPTAGTVLGSVGGGAAGAVGGPVGAIVGGMAGAGAGSAAGELGNQQILQGLGIETLPGGERASEAGKAALAGAAGTGIATALPAAGPAIKTGIGKAVDSMAGPAARFLGAQPAETKLAGEIAAEGGRVPLHSYATEAPFIRYIMQWAKQFGYDPVAKAAKETWYPAMSSELLGALGVPEAERNIVGRTSAVSLEPAGEAARTKARQLLHEKTNDLVTTVGSMRRAREAAGRDSATAIQRDISTEQTALVTQADQLRAAADKAVSQGVADLRREVGDALKNTDASPGDLSRWFAQTITKARGALGKTAKTMYDAADEMAAGTPPNTAPLTEWAKGLVDEIPPALKAEFPREVETISKLAGATEAAPKAGLVDQFGNPIQAETKDVTFGELHQLRNFLRAKVDWGNLTAGPKQGMLMRLEGEVNRVLNDVEAEPALKAAATQLRKADDFYRDNIRKFEDETVRTIAQFGRSATATDAEALAGLTLKEGNVERIRLLRDMGGDDLWNHVVAADTRAMLNAAGAKAGEVDSQEFAKQIVDRARSGVLTEAYPKEMAERLRLQADRVARYHGKNPMETHPGDSVFTMLDRADANIVRAEARAAAEPMKVFEQELKTIRDDAAKMLRDGRAAVSADPLKSVTTLGAEAAALKILGSNDLIAEVERRFGANSEAFTLLRQVYARRLLQGMADSVVPAAGREGGGLKSATDSFFSLTPETQARLFPGVSKEQMTGLVQKIIMMFPQEGADFGGSLSGASLVINPLPKFPGGNAVHGINKALLSPVARVGVGWALNLASNLFTRPQTIAFLARGLDGSPAEQRAAEAVLHELMNVAPARGAVGAAAGVMGSRAAGDGHDVPEGAVEPAVTHPGWRGRVEEPSEGGWRTRVQ